MATSDSEDFESADEELVDATSRKPSAHRQWRNPATSTIGSESDDDNECVPAVTDSTNWNTPNRSVQTSGRERRGRGAKVDANSDKSDGAELVRSPGTATGEVARSSGAPDEAELPTEEKSRQSRNDSDAEPIPKIIPSRIEETSVETGESGSGSSASQRSPRQRKPKTSPVVKKLGSKVARPPPMEASTPDEIRRRALAEGKEPPLIEECWEFDEAETAEILRGLNDVERVKMPEELTSEKKFREIFKPDGWEGLDERILSELDDDKGIRPVLDKMAGEESSWTSWGSWGVNSLINGAAVSVSTLTSHVTHGLTLLDEAMGAPSPEEPTERVSPVDSNEGDGARNDETSQISFGLNELISGVSSITKLVESTGTRVITGGLGTLETIGKKTMQVLQEGDPGLKKKRAFFAEPDKPVLSRILREAKEKAELEEKTLEDKELSRKVHFESLFDDYQGLVHLEALEMLSKQCNMKIQRKLVTLEAEELDSIQETLDQVKEVCELGDEEDEEEDAKDDETTSNVQDENGLEKRLATASKDLGVSLTYEKLNDIWKDTKKYLSEVSTTDSRIDEREVLQRAISTLARFTAFSVERFHKTAELLLIKERRSTVNEADALLQLTRIFSGQIGVAANLFSDCLNERFKREDKPESRLNVTTIFLEAANASSYIQDAFKLLIPILQVGAI